MSQSLHDLLLAFNISRPWNISSELYHMMSLLGSEKFHKFKQIGGKKQYNFNYEGKIFPLDYIEEYDRHTYKLSRSENDNMNCVMVFIPKDLDYAYIENISFFDDCLKMKNIKRGGGTKLLKMTIEFLKQMKNKYKYKYVKVRDNSRFLCDENKNFVNLDSLLMLTKGNTWYGKNGFTPCIKDSIGTDYDNLVNLRTNANLVEIIPIRCTKIKELLENVYSENKYNVDKDKLIKFINSNPDMNIKKFFKGLTHNFDQQCKLFHDIYKEFMFTVKIKDLHGISYYMEL